MIKDLHYYLHLGRYHSLIGAWLLMFPCLLTLALYFDKNASLSVIFTFIIGAILMRGAGCTINDIIDQRLDAKVARTKNRPLASKKISTNKAIKFLFIQIAIAGMLTIIFLPKQTILLAMLAMTMGFVYPFMKRITNLPQLFLGATFAMGVFIAYSIYNRPLDLSVFCLFIMCTIWTFAYDTVYAYQDRDDDINIGVGSSAIMFANNGKIIIAVSYGICYLLFITVGFLQQLSAMFWVGSLTVLMHFAWQIKNFHSNDGRACDKIFHSNKLLGLLMLLSVILGKAM